MERSPPSLKPTSSLIAALKKLDHAIQLLQEGQRHAPLQNVDLALADLESARDDLTGKKPN